jgi:beta-glucosidase
MKNFRYRSFVFILLSVLAPPLRAQTSPPDYKNPNLPTEKRVADLVSRMTLEEKILQMQNGAPGIAPASKEFT